MPARLSVIGVGLLLTALAAPGATLAFVPATTSVGVGDSFYIDVTISGLGARVPPSVSAFDLTIAFDPEILRATSVAFGPRLGDPSLFEALTGFTISPGLVNLSEFSLLDPATLDARQGRSFRLATLTFAVTGAGFTSLHFVPGTVPGIAGLSVQDGFGDLLVVSGSDGAVIATGTAVPEPGPFLLMLTGGVVMLIGGGRRR